MKVLQIVLFLTAFLGLTCSEISKEKAPLVAAVNKKVNDIDSNHRVQIIEDDFQEGDSIYKIRGYFMDGTLLKLVGVLHTKQSERIDYFYFDKHSPLFSGHVVISKENQMASEFKYYYGQDGYVDEALFWQDVYEHGKQFPHEHFTEYDPNKDSLRETEEDRLKFFLTKLDMEGFEILHLNENVEANVRK